MKIIPAIDIIDGKCVRLSKGNYNSQITYNQSPLEVAKTYEDHGIEFLHLVDLDGAKSNHIINYSILEIIASKTNLKIDFGGGIKTDNDVNLAFNCGANQVTCGSIAVKQPEIFCEWILNYGSEKIILGADVRGKYVATDGWINTSNQSIFDFINFYKNSFLIIFGVKFCFSGSSLFFPDSQKRGASFKKKNRRCRMEFDPKSVQKTDF